LSTTFFKVFLVWQIAALEFYFMEFFHKDEIGLIFIKNYVRNLGQHLFLLNIVSMLSYCLSLQDKKNFPEYCIRH